MVSAVTNLGANAAQRYLEINTSKATRATEALASGSKISNPSYDPSSAAVGYRISSNVQSLYQASANVSQATSVIQMASGLLGATQDVLTRLKELTAKANTDSVGDSERSMMNKEFQQLLKQVDVNAQSARWGGISLFTGGAGTATHSTTAATANAFGLTASGNAFTATLGSSTIGNINGFAADADVVANGSLYDVTVKIGDQEFKATVAPPVINGTLSLVSTTDPNSVISFTYDADVTGLNNAANFKSELKNFLGLNSGQTRATFTSANAGNAAVATASGAGVSVVFSPGSGAAAGTWTLNYDSTKHEFRVSNGLEYYTAAVDNPTNSTSGFVSFANGILLTLNGFDATAALSQETFDVAAGTKIDQTFQYGEKATDVLSVTFEGATASALGISGTNIVTKGQAQIASGLIDAAQNAVGSMIAELGGKASQLSFMSDTLKVSIQNQLAARASFIDADIADSMLTLQRYKGLAQVASSVFTQAMNEQTQLTMMVQNVR
ncbi:flagellin [Candidatus Odyssella thessalonicensis]|uniref:flagellin n=1 Tax=Candidatus Odyssella thessalonicensis TaxID=84647 RepID=UPI000225A8BB|nr:flagellin [Candidatus Odyssella thessalonicensis]